MSRPPIKRGRKPAGPVNESRAAGAAAPASAAATAPRSFYSPESPAERAEGVLELSGAQQFAATVADQALELEPDLTADAALSSHVDPNGPPTPEEIARIAAMRKPLGEYSQKLALPDRPGYKRHWFNDVAGRVDEAKANGWAHVQGKDGVPLKRAVGTGRDNGVMYAYAMQLPLVFWQEAMDARHAQAAATVSSTKANPFKAKAGDAKPSDKGKFYSPTEEVMTVEVK